MPFGEYSYAMDDKGRVVLPPAFRPFVEEGWVLTRGMETCLYLFPSAVWRHLEEQLVTLPLTDAPSRAFIRFFYSGAYKGRLDNQSRVSIPANLRDFAGLEDELIIAGAPNSLELWQPKRWNDLLSEASDHPPRPDLLANLVA